MAQTLANDGSTNLNSTGSGIKLRANSSGVPMSHDDVDTNFENLRAKVNEVIGEVGTNTTKLSGISTGANNYSLPLATDTARGGIELFSNTDQTVAANSVTTTASRTYGIQLNSANQAVVNVPWGNTTYSSASSSSLGLSKLGSNTQQNTGANSVTSTASRTYAVQHNSADQLVVNIPWSNDNTTYSTATSSTAGLVKIGYTETGKNYPVELSSGKMYVNVPWTDTDTNTTYTAGTGISISGTTISATGGGSNTFHTSPAGTGLSIQQSQAGYGTEGSMVAHVPGTIIVYLNDTTGTTDFTTKSTYVHADNGNINLNIAFKNVATAEQYLAKFHNGTLLNILYVFQTDITDTTLGGYARPDESFIKGVQYYGQNGELKKWTIDDLGRTDIVQVRGRVVVDSIHFHVKANTSTSSVLFGLFEGAHMLTQNTWAVELGTDVYFSAGIVGCFGGSFYGEHTKWEIKNNLTSINLCQPIFCLRGGSAYTGGQNIHSGQFHTARMLGNAEWIQYHSTCGNSGNDGNTYAGINVAALPGDNEAVGNWWQESSYTYPVGYVDLRYPAFRFEGIGNTVNWGGDDQWTGDDMRYSSIVGQTERFDVPQVGPGMANPVYSNSSTASNAGIVFNWDSPSGPSTIQTSSIVHGAAAFYMNQIHYPWGDNGTDFTHTNYRGWAFPGITPTLATQAFTIIS